MLRVLKGGRKCWMGVEGVVGGQEVLVCDMLSVLEGERRKVLRVLKGGSWCRCVPC